MNIEIDKKSEKGYPVVQVSQNFDNILKTIIQKVFSSYFFQISAVFVRGIIKKSEKNLTKIRYIRLSQ